MIAAYLTKRYPVRKINLSYGYRTKRSMKCQSNWDYAQAVYPRYLMKGGIILVILGLLLWLIGSSQPVVVIAGILGMFTILFGVCINTERKIKRFESENESISNS